jgi:hypothetical protein
MTSAQIKDIENKILEGLKLTHERLIAEKIKNDQSLAYSINGEVVVVKARELYKLKEFREKGIKP